MVYILNLKDPESFLIPYMFSLYQGLNRRPSDVEADDIPICHLASSKYTPNNRLGKKFKAKIVSEKAQV